MRIRRLLSPLALVSALFIPFVLAAPAQTELRLLPISFSGCNGNVCEQVNGTGLTVNSWYTKATIPAGVCAKGYFYVNGLYWSDTGISACGPGTTDWKPAGGMPHTFANNTQLCVLWSPNVPGEQCATVHS